MYRILYNEKISDNSYEMMVEAPLAIKNFIPGQFVIVMKDEDSERIPLTIYDYDKDEGTLTLIYQVVGASTEALSYETEDLFSIVGPSGNPSEICLNPEEYRDKKIVYVAGGVGIAPVYPQIKYLHDLGIDVDLIYGARNKSLLLIRKKIEAICSNITYVTDDGSCGPKGFVTNILEKKADQYDICIAIGPVIMMKNVCELTKKFNLKTIVSMNPLMVDGSGMCGACRCEIEGKPKFACIHGPEFDGHKVNFDLLLKRMSVYKEEEKVKMQEMEEALAKEA